MFKKIWTYFSTLEKLIWFCSAALIIVFFFAFGAKNWISFIASLIGVTALIFMSKANPYSHLMFVVFCLLYAINSYSFGYYGEVFNFLALNMTMAIASFVSWVRNPHKKGSSETKISNIKKFEIVIIFALTVAITFVFYWILKLLGTSNLAISTFSVATNFFASCLMIRRSHYFALAYALNDVVVIILWALASFEDISYLPTMIYFVVTLINDIYIFASWVKIKKSQQLTPN